MTSQNALRLKLYTDADGVEWKRRGGTLTVEQIAKLVGDPAVRVVHEYLDETVAVPVADRRAFRAAVTATRAKSGHVAFEGAEFRGPHGERLLVVHEDC